MNSEISSPAQLRARILERVRHEPSPTRAEFLARSRATTAVTALASLLLFAGAGGVRAAPRPEALVLATALGSALVALAAAIAGIARGRSMLGRSRTHLVAVAVVTPIVLLGWRLLVSSRYPDMMSEWPERPGLRCLVLSAVLTLGPLLGLLHQRRGSDPVHPFAGAAALAAAAGAAAWVLVDLWCPVGYIPHLLLGHVLPMVATTLGCAVLGGRVLRMRTR